MVAHDRHADWVEKLCEDLDAIFKIRREETYIRSVHRVFQGDYLVPTLFIIEI